MGGEARVEIGNGGDALTLRDGPIWWHYSRVSATCMQRQQDMQQTSLWAGQCGHAGGGGVDVAGGEASGGG